MEEHEYKRLVDAFYKAGLVESVELGARRVVVTESFYEHDRDDQAAFVAVVLEQVRNRQVQADELSIIDARTGQQVATFQLASGLKYQLDRVTWLDSPSGQLLHGWVAECCQGIVSDAPMLRVLNAPVPVREKTAGTWIALKDVVLPVNYDPKVAPAPRGSFKSSGQPPVDYSDGSQAAMSHVVRDTRE